MPFLAKALQAQSSGEDIKVSTVSPLNLCESMPFIGGWSFWSNGMLRQPIPDEPSAIANVTLYPIGRWTCGRKQQMVEELKEIPKNAQIRVVVDLRASDGRGELHFFVNGTEACQPLKDITRFGKDELYFAASLYCSGGMEKLTLSSVIYK